MTEPNTETATPPAPYLEPVDSPVERSTGLDLLASALAKAQGGFAPVVKSSENPHLGSRYADLAEVIAATRPALAANGLATIQTVENLIDSPRFGRVVCRTILAHSSGQWIAGVTTMPVYPMIRRGGASDPHVTPQAFAAAATYARRIGLQALLSVAGENDDDGNASSAAGDARGARRQAERREEPPPASSEAPAERKQAAGPRVAFGPYRGRPVSALSNAEIVESITLGESKIEAAKADEVPPAWVSSVAAGLEDLRRTLEARNPNL